MASYLGVGLGFCAVGLISLWYVHPYLSDKALSFALAVLVVPHAFRYIALQLFGAQANGLEITDASRDFIAFGDVAAAIFALFALWAIRKRASWSLHVVWAFAIFAFVDLSAAVYKSMVDELARSADTVMFLVSTVYVPVLYASLIMILLQLVARKNLHSLKPHKIKNGA